MPESILNFQDFLPETIGFSSEFFFADSGSKALGERFTGYSSLQTPLHKSLTHRVPLSKELTGFTKALSGIPAVSKYCLAVNRGAKRTRDGVHNYCALECGNYLQIGERFLPFRFCHLA